MSSLFPPLSAKNLAAGQIVGNAQQSIFKEFEPRPGCRFSIHTAENGYVIEVHEPSVYGSTRTLIALNVEQVRDLITAELVKAKLA